MLSGIQPTGELMLGNYVGAVKNWVELQGTHESFILLADLHAITVPQDPADLQRRSLEFVALFLACGVDAERSTIFLQSHVPAQTHDGLAIAQSVAAGHNLELYDDSRLREEAMRMGLRSEELNGLREKARD